MSQISQPALAALIVLLSVRRVVLKGPLGIVLLALLIFLSARPAAAQAAAEYGNAVAGASANLTGLTKKIDSAVSPDKKPASTLLPDKKSESAAPTGEALVATNRRALEQRAGKDAAKLTLKSMPAKALVRIDGKTVGQTPLLLTLAPGTYKVEMEGLRMEFGKQQVDLRPQETREVELLLSRAPRYPTHIRLQ
jgi:hypothetical protein